MTVPHYDVVIATPGYAMKREYVKCLVETIRYLESAGKTYKFASSYSSFVSFAREMTAVDGDKDNWETTEFGSGAYTYGHILWVDSDMEWEPSDLQMLLDADKDIISGLCPVDIKGKLGIMTFDSEGYPVIAHALDYLLEGEPIEVEAAGFGFILVKQGVFEKMPRPWFKSRDYKSRASAYPLMHGEDFSWCLSAKEVGFGVWVHPLVKIKHHKEITMVV
jgi:hypothetical protein